MTYSVTIAAEAMREYEQIVSYLTNTLRSPAAAKGFVDEFMQQVDSVRDNPELHALSHMPELATKGYRPLFVKNYAIQSSRWRHCHRPHLPSIAGLRQANIR